MSDRPFDEPTAFERRLASMLARAAQPAVRQLNAMELATSIATADPRRSGFRPAWRAQDLRAFAFLLVTVALVVAVVAAAILTSHRRPVPIGGAFATVREVAWSPDGSKLAFFVFDRPPRDAASSEGTKSLYVVDADGSGLQLLGTTTEFGSLDWSAPTWSADGGHLTYSGTSSGRTFTVALDGEAPAAGSDNPDGWQAPFGPPTVAVPGGQAGDEMGTPSPDGAYVGFWGVRSTGTGLFVVPVGGGNPVLVGANAVLQPGLFVAWQPRARPARLAFIRGRSIVTANGDGSDPRVVVPEDAIAAPRGADVTNDRTVDRVVITADGPDRAIYRVRALADPTLVVENQTDDAWDIDLFDDTGMGKRICPVIAAAPQLLASLTGLPPAIPAPDAMVVPHCLVPARASIRLTDAGFVPAGALEIRFAPQFEPGPAYVVLVEFLPPNG